MKASRTLQNTTSTATKAVGITLTDYHQSQQRQESHVKSLQAELRTLETENTSLRNRIALLENVADIHPEAPRWGRRPKTKGLSHQGLPVLLLSDCHWDEVVRPEEVEGANCYNREIAATRLKRILDHTIEVARRILSGFTYPGFHLLLGGDMLSGNIHEELEQTNEDTVLGSLDYWADQLTPFILALHEEFGPVHIDGVVGNHGRNTRKPRAKLRVRDNFDWMLYKIVARELQKYDDITWNLPESADVTRQIYSTIFRLTHGDQFRGGSGISGMMSPLFLGHARKQQRQAALHKPFDWLVMGHWHQYWQGRGLIVNSSIKGYDEWAYINNFAFERPQQAFWVVTPENGVSFPIPIFADNRKKEQW